MLFTGLCFFIGKPDISQKKSIGKPDILEKKNIGKTDFYLSI